jgi:hypothetical protein
MIINVTNLATNVSMSYEGNQIVVYPLAPPHHFVFEGHEPAGTRCSLGAMDTGWRFWMQVGNATWHLFRVNARHPEHRIDGLFERDIQ